MAFHFNMSLAFISFIISVVIQGTFFDLTFNVLHLLPKYSCRTIGTKLQKSLADVDFLILDL